MPRPDQTKAIAANKGDVVAAFGGTSLNAVMIPRLDGFAVVDISASVEAAVGGASIEVNITEEAIRDLGLLDKPSFMAFFQEVRMNPKLSLFGTFELAHGKGNAKAKVLKASGIRRATEDELHAATSIATHQAVAYIHATLPPPSISADELMELMRGGDYDEMDEPEGP